MIGVAATEEEVEPEVARWGVWNIDGTLEVTVLLPLPLLLEVATAEELPLDEEERVEGLGGVEKVELANWSKKVFLTGLKILSFLIEWAGEPKGGSAEGELTELVEAVSFVLGGAIIEN